MKKVLSIILSLCIFLSIFSGLELCGYAASDDINWTYSDGVITFSGTGSMFDFNIFNYDEADWWKYRYSIKTIVIGNGITHIGAYSFADYYWYLENLYISDTVESIGDGAFAGAEKLNVIELPSGIRSIGVGAFDRTGYSNNLDNWKDGILYYKSYLLCADKSISGICNVDATTCLIASEAFSKCTALEQINLPGTLKFIGSNVFGGCESLQEMIIPDGVVSISSGILSNCTSLKKVYIPDSVEYISDKILLGCSSLEELTVPYLGYAENSAAYLGHFFAFGKSSGNENQYFYQQKFGDNSYYIPKSLKKVSITGGDIRDKAFFQCVSLESITLGDKVKSIGEYAFRDCISLKNISLNSNIEAIPQYAFYNCNTLENVNVPEGCKTIGSYAFGECAGLTQISLPNSLEKLCNNAFRMCRKLTYINIPDTVTEIGKECFFQCDKLENITISKNLKIIDEKAFYNCHALDNIKLPDTVEAIGSYAFYQCSELRNITLSNNVSAINEYTFYNCANLNNVVVPDSVETIGYYSFANCSNLTNISVPCSTEINKNSFENGCSHKNITVTKGTGIMLDYDNRNNLSPWARISQTIEKLNIGNGVTNIGEHAFRNLSKITELEIPDSVKLIGSNAFNSCSELSSIIIPKEVKIINNNAFCYCNKLAEVYYTGSQEDWDQMVIESGNDCLFKAEIHYNFCKHIWNDGEITIKAGCIENGTKTFTCIKCGEERNETIEAVGHNPVISNAVAPTCTNTGLTQGEYCSECGEIFTEQETVDKLAHTVLIDEAIAATCSNTGLTAGSHCAVCNEIIVAQETIAKTAHIYKKVVTKATTKANGKIIPTCTACGATDKATTIYYPKTITLSKTTYVYDGKAKKPTVTVKDSKGKVISSSNYSVSYSNNKKAGQATVKVTFKGNYSGNISKTFVINPKGTTVKSVSAASKAFTVKWKKQSTETTGYEIQYSTDKDFKKNNKTVTISKNSTTSKKVTGLKAKTKYYVRIRTYKNVKISGKSKKIYSSWSKSHTVTTKK